MNNILKKFKSIVLILSVLTISTMLFSCENDVVEINNLNELEVLPIQSGKDVEISYSENGKITLKLITPVLDQYIGDEEYDEMPEGIHVITYDEDLNVSSELTANYAIRRTSEGIMEAKYNVIVINIKGETLNTEHLVWDEKTGEITSDVFVKITTTDQIIMGEGLISNNDFSEYRILNPTGIINIENDSIN